LDGGDQADVGEAELGLAVLSGDLEDDVRALPLGLVVDEADVTVHDVPNDSLARHPFGDLLGGAVQVFVAVRELGTELVRAAVDFPRPPSANVVDGLEDFFGRLVDGERRGEISIAHDVPPFLRLGVTPERRDGE
jgi:hypothetical protein